MLSSASSSDVVPVLESPTPKTFIVNADGEEPNTDGRATLPEDALERDVAAPLPAPVCAHFAYRACCA